MRSMRNSARVQRDRGRLDSPTRSKVPAHIKQNLVRFDVVVHPRNFHRFRMCIEKARRESADDVAANLESLMNGRWLMDGAGDRLEILGIEGEWINVSV